MSSKVVVGKRVAWWRSLLAQPGSAAVLFASPPALIVALYKLVIRHADMDELGYLFWGGLAVVAAGSSCLLYFLRSDGERVEAVCPVCGTRGFWAYTPPVDHPDPHGELCRTCGAYAGTNGVEVSELSPGATGEFEINSERYARDVRRDEQRRIAFQMPPFCAMCGSADVASRRKLEVVYSGPADGNGELWRQVNYARTGSRGQYSTRSMRPDKISGSDLAHIEVPVCERHVSAPSHPGPMWTLDDGTLRFASYRYYRAFCAGNRIAAPDGDHAAR